MKKTWYLLILLFGAHLFFLYNLQFTAWPEMLSYPYLKNNGFLLYQDMIHPYPPLLTSTLAIFYKLFGYKLLVMKVFLWTLILINDLFIFLIVKKLTNSDRWAVFSVLFYVMVQPFLEGNMIWFDNVVVTPLLVGIYFFFDTLQGQAFKGVKNKNLFYAGVFLAMGALVKQTAGVFLVFGVLWMVYGRVDVKKIGHFLAPSVLFGAILLIKLHLENSITHFFSWTLIYPMTKWSSFPGYVEMSLAKRELLVIALLLLPVAPLILSLKSKLFKNELLLLALFLLAGLISVYPRFSYFHLQTAIAFTAIFFGLLIKRLKVPKKFLFVYFGLLVYVISYPAVKTQWNKEARFFGQEDLKKAEIISQNVSREQTVYLLGPHSGLYAMADRLPPKPWADNFGWYLEIDGVQDLIIVRWEQDPPDFVFWSEPERGNKYDLGTYQPQKITDWIERGYTKNDMAWEGVWIWERN